MSDEEPKAPKDAKEISSEQEDSEAGWNNINRDSNDSTKRFIKEGIGNVLRKSID